MALVLVLPLAGGGLLFSANASLLGFGRCSGSVHVTVAAPEEAVGVLRDASAALAERHAEVDGRCVDYQVHAAAPSEVARSLDAGAVHAPDLWVSDSSAWLERIDGFAGHPAVVASSLARSPVVVAGPEIRQPASWREVLSRDDVMFVDPLRSSAPVAALLAVQAESDGTGAAGETVDRITVPLAQRLGGDKEAPRDLSHLVLNSGGAAVLTEQQLLDQRADGLGRDLDATVPKTGTLVLNYPLVTLTRAQLKVDAAEQLAEFLRSGRGTQLLEVAGFRSTHSQPLPNDRGAGRVRVLPTPRADVVASMLRRWSVLTVPSRILGVFDVSGSMDQTVRGRTRVSVATQASAGALGIFPDQSRIGIWAFSIGLGNGRQDYRELVKIRRLDARVGGTGQRRLLGGALAELPSLTNGGTGLYDTTLAAVRALRSDYDDEAINTVVLLTDGHNEDQHSISLPDLLGTLNRERDPARPVSVIAIGVGPDADADSLRRIVDATGGRSYVARDSGELGKVFQEALLSR